VLAAKADRDLQTGDFSGAQVRRSVERSLRLLGLDRLQLVYLHDPERTTFEAAMAPGGLVEALQRCKQEGLIEHVGVAGGPIDMESRYVETGAFEVVISHNRYTLLNVSADPLWDLAAPRITSTIVGISRPERLAQTVDLARHPIPAGVWADLQAVRPDTDDPEATRWN